MKRGLIMLNTMLVFLFVISFMIGAPLLIAGVIKLLNRTKNKLGFGLCIVGIICVCIGGYMLSILNQYV